MGRFATGCVGARSVRLNAWLRGVPLPGWEAQFEALTDDLVAAIGEASDDAGWGERGGDANLPPGSDPAPRTETPNLRSVHAQ